MGSRITLGFIGVIAGAILGWLTRPQPSFSYLGAANPDLAYMGAVLGHTATYAIVGLVLGIVLGSLQRKRDSSTASKPSELGQSAVKADDNG